MEADRGSASSLNFRPQRPIAIEEVCGTDVSIDAMDVFVIIRWPADGSRPRYSFATVSHAAEIQTPIERVQTCSTIEKAAAIVDQLNAGDQTVSKVA